MFKWLTKLGKKTTSREISYFWKSSEGERARMTGCAVGSLGVHLKVVPLGKCCPGSQVLLPKGLAVDRNHWQELWNEFNKGKTFKWEEPEDTASVG